MEYLIVCDFDGTITLKDTVDEMVRRFAKGDWESLNKLWSEGESDGSYLSQKILDMMQVDEDTLREYIKGIKIDPYFKEFITFVKENAIEFYILSDGFDFNIDAIMEENQIVGVMSFTNILSVEENKLTGIFPNKNESCLKCGNCKSNLIKDINLDEKLVIYIGDGHSDKCACSLADIIFAKGDLEKYLVDNERDYLAYESFSDILKVLKKLI